MNYLYLIGILGSLILVIGSAWPEKKNIKSAKSFKNQLFTAGNCLMFIYSFLNYQQNGQLFFVILQIFVAISTILMILDTPDKIDTPIITISGILLIIWSLYLFKNYNTIFFILGLSGIGLGYAFKMGTLRRSLALTLGSLMIAIFSYLEVNWIFFWLNIFFSIFSGFYVYQKITKKK